MVGQEVSSSSFWIVTSVICIILLVLLAQLSRFYARLRDFCRDSDARQLALGAQLKQLQGTVSEILGEIRRGNRLANELVELKQAELTGDFEIVEETIPAAAPAPRKEEPPAAPEVSLPRPGDPPKTFPKL